MKGPSAHECHLHQEENDGLYLRLSPSTNYAKCKQQELNK